MAGPSNFSFLQQEFPEIAEASAHMEKLVISDARAACFYGRRAVELLVHWLYERDSELVAPYSSKLGALLAEPSFHRVVPQEIRSKLGFVQTLGNKAVHSRSPVRQYDALQACKEVFHSCFWLASRYTRFSPAAFENVAFDQDLVTRISSTKTPLPAVQLAELEADLRKKDEEIASHRKASQGYEWEISQLRDQIAEAKKRNAEAPIPHDYSESETRDHYIDLLLREAGWDPDFDDGHFKTREFPVIGMPNTTGEGFVDYVLWHNGKPLAIVEAKRTRRDARVGQQQAKLYADCLESMFGQRPVIFYSNGYEHWIWDDHRYPPRRVQGFYKRDELELLIQRRITATHLSLASINKDICQRYFQEQAGRHITETLEAGQRKALVVMATGSGKTRLVIAVTDILQRCNWAKRVLFLADRKALVKQAANAFKTHLPHSNPVNLIFEKEKADSRILLSTYATMMGLIDESREGGKRFGVGHFDLIIIDEAHRSVYKKFRAIFEYFDSYLIGLTATPRDEVDRDTYALFEMAKGVPTYAYELEQAVEDGYLVPPKLVSVPIKYPREGIKYEDLPEEEKEEWEMTDWGDDEEVPEVVEAAAVNQWLFNVDTVDKVLKHLMEAGLKVDSGDKLGKTIIFAKNHKHAHFIQERFDANYPHLKGRFARVIDNQESYAQDLIDKFSDSKSPPDAPQIAISVDMLDTGIDVPEVVNLVFFKIVRSKTKFWQMIGRGTRLRPELYGPNDDKAFFYVFDYCGNFEFFNENPEGVEGIVPETIGARLFRHRLDLIASIQTRQEAGGLMAADDVNNDLLEIKETVTSHLHAEVTTMNVENFIVRPKRRIVEAFQQRSRWNQLKTDDLAALHAEVAGLPTQQEPEDPTAKFFDLLLLKIQLGTLTDDPAVSGLISKLREIAVRLEEVERIPAVKAQIMLIQELQTDEYWECASLTMLETARCKLRDLIKFIPKESRKIVVTNFEDQLGEASEVTLTNLSSAIDRAQYKKRLLQFLAEHENHIALHKLRQNEPLTQQDLEELERMLFEAGGVGSREMFHQVYGKQDNLGLFIRQLVGLDREAAKRAFDRYLDTTTFNSRQIQFINLIIDHLTQNGVMDPGMLFEHPFTNVSPGGPSNLFPEDDASKIIAIIRSINSSSAGAA
jgi:type I restriction enzyme, R subunit